MELVAKLIGILIPDLEISRYTFGIDNSEQNLSNGFVFIDKNLKGLDASGPSFLDLQPGNTAYYLLPPTPHHQVLALS
ncbi:MAG: hypothetical protein NPINA01_06260 [Nitrospinaceae bacterium]|nr:MAG: hypothetical protein NPINA01_06260 [Nitrospinaceae bacterium]